MNIELREFQETAVTSLANDLDSAIEEYSRFGKGQTVVLSAPTGSGKTVMMTALIEAVLGETGANSASLRRLPNPDTTFLWITDQPELNQQTKDRMHKHLDAKYAERLISIDQENFDKKTLNRGKIYFINAQKLGENKRLVRPGDSREFTFWETVRNTIEERPSSFILIIDEAHRGMQTNRKAIKAVKNAQTLIQRFVLGHSQGDETSDLPAVPIIIGVSATPDRFTDRLKQREGTKRLCKVAPKDVRGSGLLKKYINLDNTISEDTVEMTLLRSAAESLVAYTEAWNEQSRSRVGSSESEVIKPLMLVQVEDGKTNKRSKTDLARAVTEISEVLSNGKSFEDLPNSKNSRNSKFSEIFAHSFESSHAEDFGGHTIRYIRPSDIDADTDARVVFFKSALNTGWDCPRAEVMMSFRSAKDPTAIAQLVGRMVRAPLRKRIEHNEMLNGVDLYLPRYDKKGLDAVVKALTDETRDTYASIEVRKASEWCDLSKNPALEDHWEECFELLGKLPSYERPPATRLPETARLIKIATLLERRKGGTPVLADASETAKELLLSHLLQRLTSLSGTDAFEKQDRDTLHVHVATRTVRIEDTVLADESTNRISEIESDEAAITTQNVEISDYDLSSRARQANRDLGGDLLEPYLTRRVADLPTETGIPGDKVRRAQIELLTLLKLEPDTKLSLERLAGTQINEWWQNYKQEIADLPNDEENSLWKLLRPAGMPAERPHRDQLPDTILRRRETGPDAIAVSKHLYVDLKAGGRYETKLNRWEREVIEEAVNQDDVVAWLRNRRGDEWCVSIPYEVNDEHNLMYPDFLVFRRDFGTNKLVVDILDPHGLQFADTVDKAKGLCDYADKHCGDGSVLGRIEAIVKIDDRLRRLDLADRKVRDRIHKLERNWQLEAAFEGHNFTLQSFHTQAPYDGPESPRDTADPQPKRKSALPMISKVAAKND